MKRNFFSVFEDAIRGIGTAFASERNFRIHVIVAFTVVVLGGWFALSSAEWLWIVLCITLVFVTELLNTSLEKLVDLVSPDYHPLARKVKDTAAGAVLVSVVFSVSVGFIIFVPKLWPSFFS